MSKCKWCNKLTQEASASECDGCWEIRHRVESNPKLAIKIMKGLGIIPKSSRKSKEEQIVDLLVRIESAIELINGE